MGEYDRADETGWRAAGDSWWLWIFQDAAVSYYTIDEHRSSGVVKEVLGEDLAGRWSATSIVPMDR